jgi:hypothetical protein
LNDEQNKRARSRFNQEVASQDSGTGEDRLPGTYCFKGIALRLKQREIKEAIATNPNHAKRIIYAMAHIQWKNESGADFHPDVCKWMEPPNTAMVTNPGWHDCY